MITREMFLEALKQMKDASAIIEAYQMQFSEEVEKPKQESKSKYDLQVGDLVECIEVHANSKTTLTKGNVYVVRRTNTSYNERDKYFSIMSDSGKLKEYNVKNTQFKAVK